MYEGDVVRVLAGGGDGAAEAPPEGWVRVALDADPGRAGLVPADVLQLGWVRPDLPAVWNAAAQGEEGHPGEGGSSPRRGPGRAAWVGGEGAWGPGMRAGRVLRRVEAGAGD